MIFEDLMKSMEQMSHGEIQAAIEENTKLHICPHVQPVPEQRIKGILLWNGEE